MLSVRFSVTACCLIALSVWACTPKGSQFGAACTLGDKTDRGDVAATADCLIAKLETDEQRARADNSPVTINCVRDKLVQVRVLNKQLDTQDPRVVEVIGEKIVRLDAERDQCPGVWLADKPAAPAPPSSDPPDELEENSLWTDDDNVVCDRAFARMGDCKHLYFPGLVDLKLELDQPPGYAKRAIVFSRDVLVAQEEQSHNERTVPVTCDHFGPEAVSEQEREAVVATIDGCLSTPTCEAFVACGLDVARSHFAGGE